MTSAPRRSADAAPGVSPGRASVPVPGLILALALSPALVAGAGAPALASGMRIAPGVVELDQGLFCAPPDAGRREAPDTMAGWIHVPDEPVQMVATGTVAPAILGMGFGVRFLRDGAGLTGIRYEINHPPMTEAGITRQGWDSLSMAGEWDAIFFQFDVPEELVTGDWSFAAFDGTEELFHVPFTVVDPGLVPDLAGLCRGGVMLSQLR